MRFVIDTSAKHYISLIESSGFLLPVMLCFRDVLAAKLSFQSDPSIIDLDQQHRLGGGHFMLPAPAILWVKLQQQKMDAFERPFFVAISLSLLPFALQFAGVRVPSGACLRRLRRAFARVRAGGLRLQAVPHG